MIPEQYVTVRAERSRFFGPDATYSWRANSSVNRNLEYRLAKPARVTLTIRRGKRVVRVLRRRAARARAARGWPRDA